MFSYMAGNGPTSASTLLTIIPLTIIAIIVIASIICVKKFIINSKYRGIVNYIHSVISLISLILIIAYVADFTNYHDNYESGLASLALLSAYVAVFTPFNSSLKAFFINNAITLFSFVLFLTSLYSKSSELERYVESYLGYEILSGKAIIAMIFMCVNFVSSNIINAIVNKIFIITDTNSQKEKAQNESESNIEKAQNEPDSSIEKEIPKIELLTKYKKLYDMGIITQEEFNQKKKELLKL